LVLLAADLGTFVVTRGLLRAVRDYAVAGPWAADVTASLLPRGMLSGIQFATAFLVALAVTGNYGRGDQRRDARRLFLGCALATALPLWMTAWTRGVEHVLVQYALTTVLMWGALVIERFTIDRVVARVLPAARRPAPTVFVGPAENCRAAMASRVFRSGGEYQPVGFVDVYLPPDPEALGHIADFPELLHASGAETVVVCGYLSDARFHDVVDASVAGGTEILSVPRAIEVAGVTPTMVWRHGKPLIELTAPSLKGRQLMVKRLLDVVGAGLGLMVLSPVFALVALAVKLESPGPAFFSQKRIGRGGRRFRILKFRTMVDGAERQRDELLARSVYSDPRLFKVPDDPRVTRLGRWLRRTSLDELPQLFNVLRGDMSLVGPRPPLPSEVALYEQHQYARFDAPPGMTGPWQVAGRNDITDFEAVVSLETDYIRNWSLLRDLGILFRTIPVVLRARGAH